MNFVTDAVGEVRCRACTNAGIIHEIVEVEAGLTTRSSCWGAGLPSMKRRCTGCHREDGPWIDADLVGGGY